MKQERNMRFNANMRFKYENKEQVHHFISAIGTSASHIYVADYQQLFE